MDDNLLQFRKIARAALASSEIKPVIERVSVAAIDEPEVPVYVRVLNLDPIIIITRIGSSVAEFKQAANVRLAFGRHAQVMKFDGITMKDEKSLAFYGVQEGSTVDLTGNRSSGWTFQTRNQTQFVEK